MFLFHCSFYSRSVYVWLVEYYLSMLLCAEFSRKITATAIDASEEVLDDLKTF